ncbi:2Fe-2S iron-sulfur cluster-binding protein [Paraglaciecola polaris]|uniref:2Fe-2S iron-sulfur cluster-binding protein n=1 Tax=Paraglaciecola polaris TaxID=222814 RepID=UPI0030EE398D
MQLIKLIHKWASVLVGIQLLIWLLSGFYFNIMDVNKIHGDQYQNKIPSVARSLAAYQPKLKDPQAILENIRANSGSVPLPTQSIKFISLQEKPYYLLTHHKGLRRHFVSDYTLVDAYTGQPKMIDAELATYIANRSYNGPGELLSATKLTPPIDDMVREKNQVWQINFGDNVNTSVYVDARTGELISHSDDDKRLADFFFMLHFMDYNGVGGFNSWHIILFAFITLWLCLSGFIWTIQLAFGGNYRIRFLAKKYPVSVKNPLNQSLAKLNISSHKNLMESLNAHDILIPSTCGGGGTCGQCKVKLNPTLSCNSAERALLTQDEIDAGHRLACQHNSSEVKEVELLAHNAKKQKLILTHSKFLSPYIKELRFKRNSEKPLNFKAGAYIQFNIPAAKGSAVPPTLPSEFQPHWEPIVKLNYKHPAISRCYSLANYDTQTNELVFLIKMQPAPKADLSPGFGSNYICNMQPGESIEAIGPFEKFHVKDSQHDVTKTMVMIGAGSGMAPLKSIILEQLEKLKCQQNMHFYFGARHKIDLIHRELFEKLSSEHQNFHFTPVLSKPESDWHGETGYVQQIIEHSFLTLGNLNQLEFYLCGPRKMMLDTIVMLKNQGVKDSEILCDDFSN